MTPEPPKEDVANELKHIEVIAALAAQVPVEAVQSKSRDTRVVDAKVLFIEKALEAGFRNMEIAGYLQIDHSTVSYHQSNFPSRLLVRSFQQSNERFNQLYS